MKLYILFEHDYDGKDTLAAFHDEYLAEQAAYWLYVCMWEEGYSGYGARGYHVEEVDVI